MNEAEGIITYRGTVSSTNESVYIHALPVESAEMYDHALKLFRSFSVDRPILNLFTFEGQPYVITRPGREQTNFRAWLFAQSVAKAANGPVIIRSDRDSSSRHFDPLEQRSSAPDLAATLPQESRNMRVSTAAKRSASEGESDFTQIFGKFHDAKHEGTVPTARTEKTPPPANPELDKPAQVAEDPLAKTIRGGWKGGPDERSRSATGVMRPTDASRAWFLNEYGTESPEKLSTEPSAPRPSEVGESKASGSEVSEFTQVFGKQSFDQPNLNPAKDQSTLQQPPGDFTRLIETKSKPEKKITPEPQRPEIRNREPVEREPLAREAAAGYGSATQVFQSPRKGPEPASEPTAPGEYTRIYDSRSMSDAAGHSGADTLEPSSDPGREDTQTAPQPSPQELPVPSFEFRRTLYERPATNWPLILMSIFAVLVIVAVVVYIVLRPW